MTHRIDQINEVIRSELSMILLSNIDFPDGILCTITDVSTSKDLRHAKVWVSVFPATEGERITKFLGKKKNHLQSLLFKKITFKPFPQIHFVLDVSEEKASKIDSLLDKIKDEI